MVRIRLGFGLGLVGSEDIVAKRRLVPIEIELFLKCRLHPDLAFVVTGRRSLGKGPGHTRVSVVFRVGISVGVWFLHVARGRDSCRENHARWEIWVSASV